MDVEVCSLMCWCGCFRIICGKGSDRAHNHPQKTVLKTTVAILEWCFRKNLKKTWYRYSKAEPQHSNDLSSWGTWNHRPHRPDWCGSILVWEASHLPCNLHSTLPPPQTAVSASSFPSQPVRWKSSLSSLERGHRHSTRPAASLALPGTQLPWLPWLQPK